MRYFGLIILLLAATFQLKMDAQVTLSPTFGLSYAEFGYPKVYFPLSRIQKTNLLYGITGDVPIHEKWSFNTSISFCKREETRVILFTIIHPYEYQIYEHQDLNIDLSVFYKISNRLQFGVGPSMIRKIGTSIYRYKDLPPTNPVTLYWTDVPKSYFGISSNLQWKVSRFFVNLAYMKQFKNDDDDIYRKYGGKYRINLTVSTPITLQGKRKR